MKLPHLNSLLIIALLAATYVECNRRIRRQGVTVGFGLPPVDGKAIGEAINNFLGSFLGQPQNPNHNQGQPNVVNPFNIINQFIGGNNRGCGPNNGGCQQSCQVRHGRPQCFCQEGYQLGNDRRSCIDVDECVQTPCKDLCVNTQGSFFCACSDGAPLLQDGRSCSQQHAHEICAVNNGGCQQTCLDNPNGRVTCSCSKGYLIAPNQKSCVDTDECTTGKHDCPADQTCTNTNGSFLCSSAVSVGGSCEVNKGGCEHRCRQTKKGIRCLCRKGFELQVDRKSCRVTAGITKNPCQTNNGGCEQVCSNNNGNAVCECFDEFVLAHGLCQRQILPPSGGPGTALPEPQTPQPRGCGVNTKKSLFRRIVGGKPADPKDWPWMAAILRTSGDQQFCGGTLITDRHILTAAHCVLPFKSTEAIKVRLGEYDFSTPDENNPTDFQVIDIRKHENYDQKTQANDIAILKLGRPTTFSEFIWPACLPPSDNNFEDQLGYVTGWGTIDFGGSVSNVLQEVVIPVWKQADCVAAYTNHKVADTMMCAGLKAGGKDSCQGDSGGPFLAQIFPDTKWYVAGIVSWGIECASPERPGVYTRVNKYLDWIEANSIF